MNLWWRYLFGMLLAAGITMAAARPVIAESFPLELKRLDPMSRHASFDEWEYALRNVNPQHFFLVLGQEQGKEAPEEWEKEFSAKVKKQPEKYNSKRPLRGVVQLGTGKYAFVLDDTKAQSGKYDRLLFDKNHNGDLTDDEPIPARESSGDGARYVQSMFPRVDLKIDIGGAKLDYAFQVSANAYRGDKDSGQVSASFNACTYREGDVTLDGRKHHVIVLDYNSNGRFGDQVRIRDDIHMDNGEVYPEVGDMLLVDPSRENLGYAYYYPTAGTMWHYMSKLVNVEGKFYEVRISPSGAEIKLTPSPLGIGQVTNSSGPFHAMVYGEHGFLRIDGDGKSPVRIPEGEWKLLSYTIDRTDRPKPGEKNESASLLGKLVDLLTGNTSTDGPRWTIATASAKADYKAVKVSKDKTVPLPFGPPYKPVVTVGYKPNKEHVQLQMSLVGSAGEICRDMRVDSRRPATPQFTITDPKDKEVASGSFEYG